MAKDSKPSGKVGGQERGAGVNAGREAEFRVEDNVDADAGRKFDIRHTGAVDDESAKSDIDQVDHERPLNGAAKQTGSLEKHNDSRDPGPDLSSVEGVQSGGYAAQDTEEEEPALARRTAQSSQVDRT